MVCKNCGRENLDTRDTCMYCKQKLNTQNKNEFDKKNLENTDTKTIPENEYIVKTQKSKPFTFAHSLKWITLIIIIILIFILIRIHSNYDQQSCLSKCQYNGTSPCICGSKKDTAFILSLFGGFGIAIILGITFIIWLISKLFEIGNKRNNN